jgi:hypothetical protein
MKLEEWHLTEWHYINGFRRMTNDRITLEEWLYKNGIQQNDIILMALEEWQLTE